MRYGTIEPLSRREQSAEKIKEMILKYSGDIGHLTKLPLPIFHRLVREIPYKKDIRPVEVVMSPREILRRGVADCKKKAVLMGSYFQEKYGPGSWRLIASSNRPDKKITHVFPEVKLGGRWINADATYQHYRIGKPKKLTRHYVL